MEMKKRNPSLQRKEARECSGGAGVKTRMPRQPFLPELGVVRLKGGGSPDKRRRTRAREGADVERGHRVLEYVACACACA